MRDEKDLVVSKIFSLSHWGVGMRNWDRIWMVSIPIISPIYDQANWIEDDFHFFQILSNRCLRRDMTVASAAMEIANLPS
jgi:hypothetical protein